ncbi:MAG: RNA polymerase sigma factor [Gemmataceae bacterium]
MPDSRDPSPGDSLKWQDLSDHSLIARFGNGHDRAATELYLRYAHRLRALVETKKGANLSSRVDAEDIVQSVFRTFFRRAVTGHYSVPDGGELWKLFLVIALNKVRSAGTYHRAAKRDVRRNGQGTDASDVPAKQDDTAMAMLQLVLEDLLGRLPGSHRQIIEMRIEGYEIADISRSTGRARRSVERVLQEFRDRLRREVTVE